MSIKLLALAVLLAVAGCELKAEAIKACGEACKDHGGVDVVTAEACKCRQ